MKITIERGISKVTLEIGESEIAEAVGHIGGILESMQEQAKQQTELNFEKVEVKEIVAPEGVTLTEEEFDQIEASRKRIEDAQKEKEAQIQKEKDELNEKAKRQAIEKAKKAEEEKEENERRRERKKARAKRSLARQSAELDGPLSDELLKEAEDDKAEEERDIAAQAEFDKNYSEPKEPVVVENKEPKQTQKQEPKKEPKQEPKQEPKKEPEVKEPEVKETETKEEVEDGPEPKTEAEIDEKITSDFKLVADKKMDAAVAIKNGMIEYKAIGKTNVEAAISVIINGEPKRSLLDVMLKRPEVMAEKFKLSKAEVAEVTKYFNN